MSFLGPLLAVQDLDLAADAARDRSASMPERDAIPLLANRLAEINAALAQAQGDRSLRQTEEEEIDREVSQLASEIEAAELDRYSGKRKNRDEAAAHEESQQSLREKQSALEERELELLEAIESIEGRISEHESAGAANRAETERAVEAIRKVESEVAAELDRLAEARLELVPRVPEPVLKAYERVRTQPQKGGRGAATLAEGRCGACRIKLPSLEKTRMLAEPEDALLQCPQCRRVLVR